MALALPPLPRKRLDQRADALQVGPGAAILSAFLGFAQRVAQHVFDQDRLATMGEVLRCGGLVVEREGTGFRRVEIGQLTDFIACNHSGSPD